MTSRRVEEPLVDVIDAHALGVPESEWRRFVRARGGADDRPREYVSRSYRYPWAVIARHDAPVGVDLERVDAISAGDFAFAEATCTPRELERGRREGFSDLVDLWSGKEALAKALGDPLGYEPRRLDAPSGWARELVESAQAAEEALSGVRRQGIWVARRLRLTGETGRHCLGWLVWRHPKTGSDLRERSM